MKALVVGALAACTPSASPVVTSSASVPLDGAWLAVDGLPATSRIRVAANAAKSIPSLEWRPCKRAGCDVWIIPGQQGDNARFIPIGLEPVFEDAAGVHVSYLRRDAGEKYTLAIVQQLHGVADAAWWSPDNEGLAIGAASRHGVAARVLMEKNPAAPHFLGGSSFGDVARMRMTPARLDADVASSQNFTRGDGFLAVEAAGVDSARAGVYSLSAHAFVGDDPDAVPLLAPKPVGAGYVATTDEAVSQIVQVDAEGTRTVLHTPREARPLMLRVDRASNDSLVWVETPLDLGPPVLWTLPRLTPWTWGMPRRVGALASSGPIVANAGYAVGVIDGARARVTRISDGSSFDIPPVPGLSFGIPLWINATHAWFVVSEDRALAGIVRVSLPEHHPTSIE